MNASDPALPKLLDLYVESKELGRRVSMRQYFVILAKTVWQEEENFSGKRPWGNSSWQYEIYAEMVRAGMVRGRLDDNGYVDGADIKQADALILAALDDWIKELN